MRWLLMLLLSTVPLQAAEKVLILNDAEQVAMKAIFDAAIKVGGLTQLSRNAIILSDKLDAAGTLVDQKKVPEKPEKEEQK
jgi:hypothetical protein